MYWLLDLAGHLIVRFHGILDNHIGEILGAIP